MTTRQWILSISAAVICGGGLILCKKITPEIFGGYVWWVLANFALFMTLYVYA